MARPKSEEKRKAIMAAATRMIVAQGLSASTEMIAREAGVANGSLFTYFETKAELYNQLYLELKREMVSATLKGIPAKEKNYDQLFQSWSNWMDWTVSQPEKRRALQQLEVSGEIKPESRAAAQKSMAGMIELLERSRANGPLKEAPLQFVVGIMNSVVEATVDIMMSDPAHADQHKKLGFDAVWRVIS